MFTLWISLDYILRCVINELLPHNAGNTGQRKQSGCIVHISPGGKLLQKGWRSKFLPGL